MESEGGSRLRLGRHLLDRKEYLLIRYASCLPHVRDYEDILWTEILRGPFLMTRPVLDR